MKNKILSLTLLTITVLALVSCSTSRHSSGRRGYGCPSTASINGTVVDIQKV